MNTFAIVQSTKELTRACGDLSDFLLSRQRQNPILLPDTLLGIWVGSSLAAHVPKALPASPKAGAEAPTAVVETLSLSSVWSLCWLARPVSRPHLVEGLKTLSDSRGETGEIRFIPVLYRDGSSEGTIDAEIQALSRRHPELLMEPFYQERATGRLFALNSTHSRPGKMQ